MTGRICERASERAITAAATEAAAATAAAHFVNHFSIINRRPSSRASISARVCGLICCSNARARKASLGQLVWLANPASIYENIGALLIVRARAFTVGETGGAAVDLMMQRPSGVFVRVAD